MSTEEAGQCYACDTPEFLAALEHLLVVGYVGPFTIESVGGAAPTMNFTINCVARLEPETVPHAEALAGKAEVMVVSYKKRAES